MSPGTGFRKKAMAPASIARFRSSSLPWAVKKTIGRRGSVSASRRCNSNPSTWGKRKSRIKQEHLSRSWELRNSATEAKDSVLKPNDRTSRSVECLMEALSSTTSTKGFSGASSLLFIVEKTNETRLSRLLYLGTVHKSALNGDLSDFLI